MGSCGWFVWTTLLALCNLYQRTVGDVSHLLSIYLVLVERIQTVASNKKKRVNSQCKRSGHTLRFHRYVGERDLSLPDGHIDYNPKTAIFKCCNCSHQEVTSVKINWSRPPSIGKEISAGGFYFFQRHTTKKEV